MEFDSQQRMSAVRTVFPGAHLEPRRGTRLEAIRYCLKETLVDYKADLLKVNVLYEEYSMDTMAGLGLWVYSRTDSADGNMVYDQWVEQFNINRPVVKKKEDRTKALFDLAKNGKTMLELAEHDPLTWTRAHRALNEYNMLRTPKRNHQMEIIVLYGPTGTGKSRWCHETYPDAYWKTRSNGTNNWWCAYEGEETVIMDEFYGWLPWGFLLTLCDCYPMMVEAKGRSMRFTSKRIIFTTNKWPAFWYRDEYDFSPFVRRVNTWKYVAMEGTLTYNDYETFKNVHEPRPSAIEQGVILLN